MTEASYDYMNSLPTLLYVLGLSLQYIRAYRKVSDWWIGIIAVALASGGYLLCANISNDPARKEIIDYLTWIVGGAGSVAGGTFTAAKAAQGGASFISKTDSKG